MPLAWKEGIGKFLPQPGKESYFVAKSFRMITLTSFQLKWLETGPARGGFRGYIVPGPGPRGPGRVQVSALDFGIAP